MQRSIKRISGKGVDDDLIKCLRLSELRILTTEKFRLFYVKIFGALTGSSGGNVTAGVCTREGKYMIDTEIRHAIYNTKIRIKM